MSPNPPPGPAVPPAALRLVVDTDALVANWRALDRLSGGGPGQPRAGAAVKANAYGVGARLAVPALRAAGVRDFFVAHWGEAAELRDLAPPGSIAVLHGPMNAAEAEFAKATGLKPVINTLAQARHWLAAGGGLCDVMVDTGMNRLGLPIGDLADPAITALNIDVLHAHLACADEDSAQNGAQRGLWQAARGEVAHPRGALANSAGITLGRDYLGDLTRPGLALYGGVPCAALEGHIGQVARPQAAIIQTRWLGAGDTVGYNATFVAPHAMRVGVVALGYADGYLRCWSGRGSMAKAGAEGARCLPVLGRVSMDMTVIDLTAAPELAEGDWVDVDYALPAAARVSGLSQYELLTLLGARFAR